MGQILPPPPLPAQTHRQQALVCSWLVGMSRHPTPRPQCKACWGRRPMLRVTLPPTVRASSTLVSRQSTTGWSAQTLGELAAG